MVAIEGGKLRISGLLPTTVILATDNLDHPGEVRIVFTTDDQTEVTVYIAPGRINDLASQIANFVSQSGQQRP